MHPPLNVHSLRFRSDTWATLLSRNNRESSTTFPLRKITLGWCYTPPKKHVNTVGFRPPVVRYLEVIHLRTSSTASSSSFWNQIPCLAGVEIFQPMWKLVSPSGGTSAAGSVPSPALGKTETLSGKLNFQKKSKTAHSANLILGHRCGINPIARRPSPRPPLA